MEPLEIFYLQLSKNVFFFKVSLKYLKTNLLQKCQEKYPKEELAYILRVNVKYTHL